jgi:hypothetical protein
MEPAESGSGPFTLRNYAFIADGERGALIDPHGRITWMCAPSWHDDAVFAALVGGNGSYEVAPVDPWRVWGGEYIEGTLIYVSRWVLSDGVIECREALAMPADTGRVVVLRQIRAVEGDAHVKVRLDARAGFGEHPMADLRLVDDEWCASSGPLQLRLSGASHATPSRSGALTTELTLREGERHDLVLQLGRGPLEPRVDAGQLWSATEAAWAKAVPDCPDLPAARDARQAYAILHGLTSSGGGMVAAATTSLPERAPSGRSYDYRYAWIRDQCYAGNAVAALSAHQNRVHQDAAYPLLDAAVGFVTERILQDGDHLHPAYCVNGDEVPPERDLDLPGYPGGTDKVGNRAGRQFQLDTFGEALTLFASAARLGRLSDDAIRAAHIAADAVAKHWQDPDAGIWELKPAWWTHSRLAAAVGLHAAAGTIPGGEAEGWDRLATTIVNRTKRLCRQPNGAWQRSAADSSLDAAVLRPLSMDPRLCGARSLAPTRAAIEDSLTQDGYVYRFRHGDTPLGEAEGAFLLCGFLMAQACHTDNKPVDAVRWFERTRTSCGPAGLFAEEYDVQQRQLRGNLPQAFVHALLLETAVILGGDEG